MAEGEEREVVQQMAEGEEREVVRADPKFISYLLNPNLEHDTYFLVEETKIGAVRKMLAAHCDVLRRELEESELAEKGEIKLTDISPEAFKNLLRYVYGYNNISTMSFDDADDLFYVAEKYMIPDLKDQLAPRMMDLLDSENIFMLLNNPVYDTALELDSKITNVLQYETDFVLDNPEFVNLRVEGFVKILKQDTLFATELDIWKAALKWAKNQASSEDGPALRKYISQLKHIRIHCFTVEVFCTEVVPTSILSYEEVVEMFVSHEQKEKPHIEGFSEKTDQRKKIKGKEFTIKTISATKAKQSSFTIAPTHDIVLLPFEFIPNRTDLPDYDCEVTIDVTHLSSSSHSSLNPLRTVIFNERVNSQESFKVSLTPNCRRLLSNNSYKISITFNSPHLHYCFAENSYSCKSFSLTVHKISDVHYALPFHSLKFIKCV